jgi:carboxyl-terminal processing protease
VSTRIVGDGIGYVRIRNWVDGGVASPLRDALLSLEGQGTTRWIIDLRDNPGGRLDVDAMSLFVREGVILRERARGGAMSDTMASGETLPVLRPTVVLTNNRTGSVSEMFVAALDEYGLADVVGAKTNGCVGFTAVEPLGDGSSLAVTTHVHLGPVTSAPLNGVGVIPDETVSRTAEDIAAGRDPQLDAAIARLSP